MGTDIGILRELPPELQYLAEPAIRYGDNASELLTLFRLWFMSAAKRRELQGIAARVKAGGDYPKVLAWLKRYEITEYEESARLYFLFGLLDSAGYQFE